MKKVKRSRNYDAVILGCHLFPLLINLYVENEIGKIKRKEFISI